MDEIVAGSWAELIELLYTDSWNEPIKRFRSRFGFRGCADSSDDLTTSLMRLVGDSAYRETHLLRNFRKYARRDSVPGDSVWNWLALGQHHGMPTRLLDWTFSPFVALHFVTSDIYRFDCDGVVWCVDYVLTHESVPAKLRDLLENEGSDVFTTEMLAAAADSLESFDSLAKDAFPLFFEPPSLDERIVNQFALFSLMSSATARLSDWLETNSSGRRILIPASIKWEIRDKLDQANITERVLFPGLDGLGRWLSRYYGPREK